MSDRTTQLGEIAVPLIGPELKVGDPAPDFLLQESTPEGMRDLTLADFAGKTLLLSVLPSLDTPVCAIQTRKFNQYASQLPDSVSVVTVSTDLPFAQGRFCGAEGLNTIRCASDHRDVTFGKAYGVLMYGGPFDRVLSRAIFVIGPDSKLTYVQYVPKVGDEPDYEPVIAAVS